MNYFSFKNFSFTFFMTRDNLTLHSVPPPGSGAVLAAVLNIMQQVLSPCPPLSLSSFVLFPCTPFLLFVRHCTCPCCPQHHAADLSFLLCITECECNDRRSVIDHKCFSRLISDAIVEARRRSPVLSSPS